MKNECSVVIAGAGPTGMVLAAELALAGVDVTVIERRATQELEGSRAGGLHARAIEMFAQRGIADRFVSRGKPIATAFFGQLALDLSDFPSPHPYVLGIWQNEIEQILADWIGELGVTIHRSDEVTGFTEDASTLKVSLASGATLRAQYLVGCDGGRSGIRKAAGIEFPGWDAQTSFLIAEAETTEEPAWGVRRDEKGIYGIGKLDDGRARIVVREDDTTKRGEPTLDELRRALVDRYGTDFGLRSASWLSRFTDLTRQAATYRAGRVLLAGDAAHVHAPVGGQGLNLGVQDAMNLGWKLGQVVRGDSPDALLDTYGAERHPVEARILRATMAMMAIHRGGDRIDALRDAIGDLLTIDEARRRWAGMLSGLDVHYDLGAGPPLLGRRMPDLELATANGPKRVFELLHRARPVLVVLEGGAALDVSSWADRVTRVDATYGGAWELPVLGKVDPPKAVLIRPDGYVAWVGDGSDAGLADAMRRWFGR